MSVEIIQVRRQFTSNNKKLRRARRLYAYITFSHRHSTDVLHLIAGRAKDRGLYAPSALEKDIQFSFLRMWWHIERAHTDVSWYEWLALYGWRNHHRFGGWRRSIAA